MPARKIDINLTATRRPRVSFSPVEQQALIGDLISWANNDPEQSHWPAPVRPDGTVDQTGFMSQAIPPDASSHESFSPTDPVEIHYRCVLHSDETGVINVLGGPPALAASLEGAAGLAPVAVPAAGKKPKPKPTPKPKRKSKAKPKLKPKAKTGQHRFAIVEWLTRLPTPWRTAFACLLLALAPTHPSSAQPPPLPAFVECAPFGTQPLVKIPEVNRDPATRTLRAVLITADEPRNLWFRNGAGFFCAPQYLRYFKGYRLGHPEDWNVKSYTAAGFPEPIPGPTLRTRVGDLVQITFLNQIQTKDFGNSIDRGEMGLGCDQTKSAAGSIYPGSDTMPNCIHGSSTSNLHFHGTHTTPSTTGDNVLVQIRPSLRTYPPEPNGTLVVTEEVVRKPFAEFFKWCEANGSPTRWDQMPRAFRERQMGRSTTSPGGWIGAYDRTAAYKPAPLWPQNQEVIRQGGWPTYFIGAFPYCFRLPEYDPTKVKMGQAPGTHWYHAHKHGSTDINVSNGMTGALIIEGAYDDTLREFYKTTREHQNWGLEDHVLVIQQLSTVPSIVSGSPAGPAALSVNGRQRPIVTMRPGQVQLWRFVNGSPRNMVTLCPVTGLTWRQTAQDGVQFSPQNYTDVGKPNARVVLAAANRADLLVQAPTTPGGEFTISVVEGVAPPAPGTCPATTPLLTVRVDASLPAAQPQMPFIDQASFPRFPDYLQDIPASDIRHRRELVFATVANPSPFSPPPPRNSPPANSHYIDNEQFADHRVDQSMLLDTVEEWKLLNRTINDIHHPFHIHVNPFQVTEVFDPKVPSAMSGGACPADPTKPETWKPCPNQPAKNFVWWDVFPIPSGRQDTLAADVCTVKEKCPEPIRDVVQCAGGTCKVTIPGYFKMRSRFADYTGQFVLHCHILIHEDRGMMQLIQVVPNTTIHRHR